VVEVFDWGRVILKMLKFRTRLILIHLAVIVVVLACSGFGAYWMLSRAVHNQLDAALLAIAETEAAMLKTSMEQPIRIHEAPLGATRLSFVRIDRLVQIVDSDGQVLARSTNLGSTSLPIPQALLIRLLAGETVFQTLSTFGDEPVRMVSMPINGSGTPMIVQVAGSLDDVRKVLNSASLLFIIMTLGLLAAVGTVGASLTRKVFQAIDNVVRQARHIGEVNLSERLPHPGTRDEIGKLVNTLNEMLDRIERSFEVQRRFTADASHELRSPLSRLRTELEITLRRPRDMAEYQETLQSCMDEVERLTLIVEELLALARLDADLEHSLAEIVPLNLIIEEVVDRMKPIADKRGVQIIVEPLIPMIAKIARGSMDLILTNLLDNAVKFSPPGGSVTIRLDAEGTEVALSVSDTGSGIKLDEQLRLFERFYRGSVARTNDVPGVGLGLALSQAVVRSHGGRIEVENLAGGGAMFTVRLPFI
jgi:two-component system OmpR family sensor kinase